VESKSFVEKVFEEKAGDEIYTMVEKTAYKP